MINNLNVYNYYTPHLDKEHYGLKQPPMVFLCKFSAYHENEEFRDGFYLPLGETNGNPYALGSSFAEIFNLRDNFSFDNAFYIWKAFVEHTIGDKAVKFDTSAPGVYLLNRFSYCVNKREEHRKFQINTSYSLLSKHSNYGTETTYEISREGEITLEPKNVRNYHAGNLAMLFNYALKKNLDQIMFDDTVSLDLKV